VKSAATFSSGFTLIETLVALSLLGLVAILLSGGFQFGARAWEITSQEIARIGEVEGAQGFLRRQISQALPLTLQAAAAQPEPIFAGSAQDLRFSAPLSFHRSDAGLYVFLLEPRTSGSTEDLVLQWQIYRPDRRSQDMQLAEPLVVIADIADLQLSYYGRRDENAEPMWQSEWKAKGLPMLIRLDIAFPRGDRRSWPSFVIAVKSSSGMQPR
jgi:general secretion pathway protein J